MQLIVPKPLMVEAYIDVKGVLDKLKKARQAVKPRKARRGKEIDPKTFLSWYDEETKGIYVEKSKAFIKSLEDAINAKAMRYARWCIDNRYIPGLFLLSTYLFPVSNIVPFIAQPPQITHPETWPKPLKVSTYINLGFTPVGNSRNIIAKYFYSEFYAVLQIHMSKLFQRYPRLEMFYRQQYSKYINKGQSKSDARKKAMKDLVRLWIGSAWLVWTYFAYEQGLISYVILPYHLAKDNPALHLPYMIDPKDMVLYTEYLSPSELRGATWKWLVDVGKPEEPPK